MTGIHVQRPEPMVMSTLRYQPRHIFPKFCLHV
jgi:hypothetical protein